MEFLAYTLIFFVLYYLASNAYESQYKKKNSHLHCMTCGSDGQVKRMVKGTIFIEIILWLCFLVPGLIYSVWRLTTKSDACSVCGSTSLVPGFTPAAAAHKKSLRN